MRLIKFRGKRVNSNEWVYGGGVVTGANNITVLLSLDERGWPCVIEVKPKTIGQYTGLKAKSVEIYEGDILTGGVVEWFDNLTWDGGGSLHPGFYCRQWFEYEAEGELSYHYGFDDSDLEVIGNHIDNLELIKESKK